MNKPIKIERIKCSCGQVIAGCVHGEQDARWDSEKRKLMRTGCEVDIVDAKDFSFGKCLCDSQPLKMRFKVMAYERDSAYYEAKENKTSL